MNNRLVAKPYIEAEKCFRCGVCVSMCPANPKADLQARRISAAENLLREDLSMIESIEATIEIIDVEMGKDAVYLTVGKTPLERVHQLLSKLDSIRRSKERGSVVSELEKDLSHKFMGQVESIFKNLPKPLEWRSFQNNDLILLTDIPSKVQKASVKHSLNKAKI